MCHRQLRPLHPGRAELAARYRDVARLLHARRALNAVRETLELRERIREKYGIEVAYVRADETVEAMEGRLGGPIYRTRPDECCRIRKIEPLKRAVAGRTAWISAIRRDQTAHRAVAGVVQWDAKFGLLKLSPLANWTEKDVWAYIAEHELPYNALHDQGYASIGCAPCTLPGSAREGRWAGSEKTECGIHGDG